MAKKRRIDITIGANADKRSFDASQKRLDKFMDNIESKSKGATDKLSKLLLTTGGMETGFRVAGAAAAIFSGDLGAMRSALEKIPGGVGPAIAAFNELSDIWTRDTETLKMLRVEMAAAVKAANEGITATLAFEQSLDRSIAKARGEFVVPEDQLAARAQADRLNAQASDLAKLAQRIREAEVEAGGAINFEPMTMATVSQAFQDGDMGRGLFGTLGLIPLVRDQRFNLLADTLDQVGVEANNSAAAIDEIVARMAEMWDQADTLIEKSKELAEVNAENAVQASEDQANAIAEKLETENRLLLIEDEFARKRERLRLDFADRIAKAESDRIADALRERLGIELRAINDAEFANSPFVGPVLPDAGAGGISAVPSPRRGHPSLPGLLSGRLITGAASAGRSALQTARERREQREDKAEDAAAKEREEQNENLRDIIRLLGNDGQRVGALLAR